jgi:hypothetical protein
MITSIVYTNPAETTIFITTSTGDYFSMPWPNGSEKGKYVQAWLDEGNTITPYSQPLAEAKEEKILTIEGNYYSAEEQSISYDGRNYDADKDALTEIMSVAVNILGGYTLPPGFTWIDVDGNEVSFAPADVRDLFQAMSIKHYQDAHNLAGLKKQVMAAGSVDEVNAIPDW